MPTAVDAARQQVAKRGEAVSFGSTPSGRTTPVSGRGTHAAALLCFWCLSPTMMGMVSIESPLLSTGEVAGLLGVSRQHVVDLCDRGDLIFVRVGSHRRVPQFEPDLPS
jgi:excisionase family DNA binding protein